MADQKDAAPKQGQQQPQPQQQPKPDPKPAADCRPQKYNEQNEPDRYIKGK